MNVSLLFSKGYKKITELYYVPGSYVTIQAAINASANGDTIYVSAGSYPEAIYLNKNIALIGIK
ncbi:MAG: hypothetical protein AB1630_03415 [bacterium]